MKKEGIQTRKRKPKTLNKTKGSSGMLNINNNKTKTQQDKLKPFSKTQLNCEFTN